MKENELKVQPILVDEIENKLIQINSYLNKIIDFFDKISNSNTSKIHNKVFEMEPSSRYFKFLRVNLSYFKYIKYSPDNNLNKKLLESLTKILNDLTKISTMINDLSNFTFSDYHAHFESIRTTAESSLDFAYGFIFNKIDADIKKIENISNSANKYSSIVNSLKQIATDQLADIETEIRNAHSQQKNNLDEMEAKLKTLDNQVGQIALAHSFNHRINELKNPRKYWLSCVVGSFIFIPIAFILFNYIFPFVHTDLWTSLLIRSPLAVALFWFTWFSSKKYSYVCHVQDDYRYKYDLAMAYKGYSDEAMKVSTDGKLLALLLGSLVENISRSPIDINPEYHSPWAETISPIIEKVSKQPNK